MNQILVTEVNNNNNNNRNKERQPKMSSGGTLQISSIAKFFAVAIIIFGIILSSNGAYGAYQIMQEKASTVIPEVSAEKKGNLIKLTVKSSAGIKSVKYSWNDSTEKVVEGKNKTEVSVSVSMSTGNAGDTSKLNISVVDCNNLTTKYVKNYIQEGQDTTNPEIEISNEDPKIKITVTDDTALDHVVYKYGNNDEVTVQASQDDPTKIEIYIDNVLESLQTLQIEAIDKAQNTATKTQDVKGTTKSKIEVTQDTSDPSYVNIKVTDNDGIRMVAFYVNDQEYQTDPNTSLNTKTFEYKQKINKGTNTIKVHAYNISEQVTEYEGTFNY